MGRGKGRPNTGGDLILKIVCDDMCISCGTCIHACPSNNLIMEINSWRGAYGPSLITPERCEGCKAICVEVCPSYVLDFRKLLEYEGEYGNVGCYGNIINVFVGHSLAFQNDRRSSSGGIIREVLTYLNQEEGRPIIALGEMTPGYYEPMLISNKEEIKKLPGSIYHNIPFHQAIALLHLVKKPCVIVATPCQLASIKKYIFSVEPKLGQYIYLSLGLICGWMFSHHAVRAFALYKRIGEEVKGAAYRGEDKVGKLKIFTKGREYSFPRRPKLDGNLTDYFDYYAAFSHYSNLLRCRVCEDHLNILADIAVGDAWLKRAENKKESIILTRTIRGECIIASLASRGLISLEMGSQADIAESQSIDLVMGYTARTMNANLKKRGIVPNFLFHITSPIKNDFGKVSFYIELGLRYMLRKEHYRAFRSCYMLINITRYMKQTLYQLKKKLLGGSGIC